MAHIYNMLRRTIKATILKSTHSLGCNRVSRFVRRSQLLVLCYHAIIPNDTPENPRTNIAVTVRQFESHITELLGKWRPVSESQLLASIEAKEPLPAYSVLFTFDDGYRNNHRLAAPLLQSYGIPAIFFVTTGLIDGQSLLWTHEVVERIVAWPLATLQLPMNNCPTRLGSSPSHRIDLANKIVTVCKTLPDDLRRDYLTYLRQRDFALHHVWQRDLYAFMTWPEVCDLHRSGFSIGAHTIDHPILANLQPDELNRQLVQSKNFIEKKLQTPVLSLAYPNGSARDYSRDVVAATSASGYRLGFTLREKVNPPTLTPFEIDRICVTRDVSLDLFRARISKFF